MPRFHSLNGGGTYASRFGMTTCGRVVWSITSSSAMMPLRCSWIGVNEGHHGTSHHQDKPEKIAAIARINTYYSQLLAYFAEKLAATPDGSGSLLDHSMVLQGSGMSNGNAHDHKNLPLVLLGGGAGKLRSGRHIKFGEMTPMANLLLGLLDKAGVPADSFGDSTGRVDLEPLSLLSDA